MWMFNVFKIRELIWGPTQRKGPSIRKSPESCRKCANETDLPLTVRGAGATMTQPGRENFYHLAEFRGEFTDEWSCGRAGNARSAVPYFGAGSGTSGNYRRYRQTGAGLRSGRTHSGSQRSREAFFRFSG